MDKLNSLGFDACAGLDVGCPTYSANLDVIHSSRSIVAIRFVVEPCEYQLVQAFSNLYTVSYLMRPSGGTVQTAVIESDIALRQSRGTGLKYCINRNKSYTQVVIELIILYAIVAVCLPVVCEVKCTSRSKIKDDCSEGSRYRIVGVRVGQTAVIRDVERFLAAVGCCITDYPCIGLRAVDKLPSSWCLKVFAERNTGRRYSR